MTTTLKALHQNAIEALRQHSESARLDAELLIAHVLNIPRTRFITEPDQTIEPVQLEKIEHLITRRQTGYPVAYLVGKKYFWDLELIVTEDTLIPRPETELLVETALNLFATTQNLNVADLGTGSGAIAIALAKACPHWHIIATDIHAATLEVAQQNVDAYEQLNIQLLQSHWFEKIDHNTKFDLIVSNPPYIAQGDPHLKRGAVQFEPQRALSSGQDGLDDIRHIIKYASPYLNQHGWLMLEHGYDQAEQVKMIFESAGYQNIHQRFDLADHIRITYAQPPVSNEGYPHE